MLWSEKMTNQVKSIILFSCALVVLLFAVFFYSRIVPIEASMPAITRQMVLENQEQQQAQATKRQTAALARWKAELETKLYTCSSHEDCIIVDKDPCGCLNGPEGVTAINSEMVLDFSRLIQKQFSKTTSCPTVGSLEKECSSSARPVCIENNCKIIY